MSSIRRAFEVLSLLSARPDGMGIQELHEMSGIPLGSLHRVVTELVEDGYLSRTDANPRYFLGPGIRRLTETPVGTSAIAHAVSPHLRKLAAETGETVFIAELHGVHALCTAIYDGTHSLRLFVRLGQRMPLHAAAAARVLLAHISPAAARMLLSVAELKVFQDRTPQTVDDVLARLPGIAEAGYDIADGDFEEGVWAVAAPVRSSTGRVVASVTLAGSSARIRSAGDESQVIQSVRAAAIRMSSELGWSEAPPR